jgi:hypothetical protein
MTVMYLAELLWSLSYMRKYEFRVCLQCKSKMHCIILYSILLPNEYDCSLLLFIRLLQSSSLPPLWDIIRHELLSIFRYHTSAYFIILLISELAEIKPFKRPRCR